MRSELRRLLALALCVAGCSPGSGGAVVMRWRFIDAPTGLLASGCRITDGPEQTDVTVKEVRLRVVPVDSSLPEQGCTTCTQPCTRLEATTDFEIPEGRYYFSLEARSCCHTIGDSPPPVERTVLRGEIANLYVIGISIAPGTQLPTGCDPLAPPAGCPDASLGAPTP